MHPRHPLLLFAASSIVTGTIQPVQADTWTGISGDWDGASAWAPGPNPPDGPSAFADFSTLDYTAPQTVDLEGDRTVGTVKIGDLAAPVQTITLRSGSQPSTLTFDNGGSGALIDTVVSSDPPPSGFNRPPGPNSVFSIPVILQDDLTININTGPVPGGGTTWFGAMFNEPLTELGGPHGLTIDGNGNGMTGLLDACQLSGGVTVNAGNLSIGFQGDLGSSPITVNPDAQVAWFGERTIPNDMTINGNGWLETDGQRGAIFFAEKTQTTTGTINVAGTSRIEGGQAAKVQLDGPLSGSANLELNALVGGSNPEERIGAFFLRGDASGFTGNLSVSRGSLQLGPDSNLGGGLRVSKLASLSGEAAVGGDLVLGTPAPGSGISSRLTIDPNTPAALHCGGDLNLDGTTTILFRNIPPSTCTVASYGGSFNGDPADLDLVGGLASYRPGTAFDTESTPGQVLLNVVRDNLVWNAGTAQWDTVGTTWTGGSTFHSLDNVSFDDTNVGGSVITIVGDLQVSTIHVNNTPGNDYTFQAESGSSTNPLNNSIASGGLLKDGGGNLNMGSMNGVTFNRHSFPGGTVINDGRVRVLQGGDANLTYGPLGVGAITMNGGALSGQGIFSIGLYNPVFLNGDVTLGESGQPRSFGLRSLVTLGASLTINTESEVALGKGNDPLTGLTDHAAGHSLTKTGSALLELSSGTASSLGGETTVESGTLQVGGTLTCTDVTVSGGATLAGIGTITAAVTVNPGASLAPGTFNTSIDSATLAFDGDLSIRGSYQCELENFSRDHLDVTQALDITDATLDIDLPSGPASQSAYVIATYGTLVGSAFASVEDLPAGYGLDYAYDDGNGNNHIAVVLLPTPYDIWAAARGLTEGVNDDPSDDPNNDGKSNLLHFAFDTDPLGSEPQPGRTAIATIPPVGTEDFLTLTIPVRGGAVFSGTPLEASIDNIVYTALGSTNLQDPWDLQVVEVNPALDADLPALGDYDGTPGPDWEYRTFRLPTTVADEIRGFLRMGVSP
jgi:autotransporter-associated beta strand protein